MISFIVPAHNEEAWIGRCVSAIRSGLELLAEPYEIIVVADAPSQIRLGYVARFACPVWLGHRLRSRSILPLRSGRPLFGTWRTLVHNTAGVIDYGGTVVGFLLLQWTPRRTPVYNSDISPLAPVRPQNETERRRPAWTWICGASSVALLLTFVTMAAHVRVGLGHWPTPMTEDYRTLGFRIHEWALIGILMFTVYAAGPLWLVFLFFRRLRLSWRAHLAQLLVFGVGWLLIFLAGKYDPTSFTDWFLD